MRDYSKVGPKFWIGTTGKRLRAAGMEAQLVAMYLLTSPHANMLGLYYCPVAFIAHETGMCMEAASKGLRRAIQSGFCEYDEASEVVWVYEMARFQIADALKPTDLRVKGVQNEYDSLPENPYLTRFFEKYSGVFHMESVRTPEQVESVALEAPSKPLRSQEQEQEQEQKNSESHDSGGTPPQNATADELIFAYGVPLLVNAGTPDKNARSFLGGLRKAHGDVALVEKLRECIAAKPLQPLEWLAAALPIRAGGRGKPFAARDYGSGGRL